MSILSPNYAELMQDRIAEREATAKARPVGRSKSKFRDIELLQAELELAALDPLSEFGDLR